MTDLPLSISSRVKSMKPSATLGMAQAARELADAGVDVVIMSAGEPDFETPKIICEVSKNALDQGKTHYAPVRGNKAIIAAMVEKFRRDQGVLYAADEVMCTVGAKSAILLALEAIVDDGDEVIIFAPFWVSYEEQIRLAGGVPIVVQTKIQKNFMPDGADVAQAITKKTKAIILNSPNNPSGAVIDRQQIKELSEALSGTSIWLISDEIYEKLLFDDSVHLSPARENSDMRERTIVISGASKGYAMTGWRVGVVAGNKKIIAAMTTLQGQTTTCLPEFIQDAAAFALRENDDVKSEIKKMVDAYRERRDFGTKLFQRIPHLNIFSSKGAFYLWIDFSFYIGKKIKEKVVVDDIDLATRMLREAHVASVPGTPFHGPGFLRLSIASSKKDIEKAAERIEKWLR